MAAKYCPNCGQIVITKVDPSGYKQIRYEGVVTKRRKIRHREEDGGCGYVWYTYESPGVAIPGLESQPPREGEDE